MMNLGKTFKSLSLAGIVGLTVASSGCASSRHAEIYFFGKSLNDNAKSSEDIRILREQGVLAPSVSMNSEYKVGDKKTSYGVVESSSYSGNSRENLTLSDIQRENKIVPIFLLRKTW